jgi:hypothetical protein
MERDGIVNDGIERLLKAPETGRRIDQAVREIEARYEQQSKGLGKVARAALWWRKRREIRAAVEKIAPSRACYARND